MNIGVKDADYVNEFVAAEDVGLARGLCMTWFGGSKMHDQTPVIRRMIPRAHGGDGDGEPLMLFCRIAAPKTGPYVCMVDSLARL